ncbi:C2H2-type zinc finger protein [Halomicrobium salinisoli]|uniref:C2H2-type zinc finger protein n=1 Tax=Halomicrobium salinisoli TaxID=2878391 RepID=UPI001CF0C544|nr:C2H2-type zinc finger protein [Halomicrobium salinisoli]
MSDAHESDARDRDVPDRVDRTAVGSDAHEYDVPTDEPVYRCDRCGRPFAREDWLRLHRGVDHPGDLDDEEIAAYRDAFADEQADIRRFRLKALGALILIYFGLLMIYAVL